MLLIYKITLFVEFIVKFLIFLYLKYHKYNIKYNIYNN